MTSAVLKNRLLDMTERRFDERRYGYDRFSDLLRALQDVLSVDWERKPPSVSLRSETSEAEVGARLKRDLWQAVMDYSSGLEYVWDTNTGRARPRQQEERDLPALPTISREELAAWRREFAKSLAQVGPQQEINDRIRHWAEAGLSTSALPREVRGEWNRTLRERAAARLRSWFQDQHLAIPPGFIVVGSGPMTTDLADDSLEAEREFVLTAIEAMSADELRGLLLPARAAFRAKLKRK
jgi:OST-HTH/LOTUS domain